jgi:CheY-like chemotaxis protein
MVLVVDDDATTRTLVRASLEQLDLSVEEAANGEDALASIDQSPPDLVLLDISMPIMDGLETCRRIRKMKGTGTIPIIMLTGLADADSAKQAASAGATDYVTKPINWRLLGQRVRHFVNVHAKPR